MALAVVSIIGFLGIVFETIIGQDITKIVEASWLLIVGLAMLVEVNYQQLSKMEEGLTKRRFVNLTTLVLGGLALVAGVLSIPGIRFENPGFLAIKGILSIIAIAVIVIQTWVTVDENL